jgi:hypothetical protein
LKLALIRLAAIGLMLVFPCLADGQTVIGGWDVSGKPHAVLTMPPAAPSGAEPIATSNAALPSFATRTPYYNGQGSYSVTVGPLMGDAGIAIVAANSSSNTVSCYIPRSDGTLPNRVDSLVTSAPRMVAMGDFNEDGRTDIAVANRSSNVTVYFGDGGCGFGVGTATTIALTGETAAQAIGAARLGSSTHWSVVAADRSGTTIDVAVGGGDGGFAAVASYTGQLDPYQLVLKDVNGDGWIDLLEAGEGDNMLGILFGASNQTFSAVQSTSILGNQPAAIAVGDINSDGVPDIVLNDLASASNAGGAEVLLGKYQSATNHFTTVAPSVYYAFNGNNAQPQGVVVADLNGDGFLDVASSVSDDGYTLDGISVLSGNGRGGLAYLPLLGLSAQGAATGASGNGLMLPLYLTAADINGDGHPDLLVPNFNGGASLPNLFVLLSQATTQIVPALGATFQVTPSPASPLGSSPGPEAESTTNCVSSYATYLGTLSQRRSIAIQTQYDSTPIWVGGPHVTTCPGCPFSISDAGFSDGGPGVVGEEVQAGGYLSKDLGVGLATPFGQASATALSLLPNGLWCIKASGAQDGTFDGGWTVTTELP